MKKRKFSLKKTLKYLTRNKTFINVKLTLSFLDGSTDSQENGLLIQHRPSLQSVESEQGTSNFTKEGPRRHSNFTNSSLNFLSSSSIQADIKPTG